MALKPLACGEAANCAILLQTEKGACASKPMSALSSDGARGVKVAAAFAPRADGTRGWRR
jgi:hypothetical protein